MWMKSALPLVLVGDLLGDVDDRAADAALAEGRRGEDEHDRFLADHVGEVDLVHLVGRDPGVDLRQVAADVGGGRGVDHRRLLADLRDPRVLRRRPGRGDPRRFERRSCPSASRSPARGRLRSKSTFGTT